MATTAAPSPLETAPAPRKTRALPRAGSVTAFLLLAVLVLLTQLGGLAREMIDWDETTFILMGADVAKGHLPFVEQFDLKPPGVFLLIGASIALFGKSLAAIRLLGDLCLLASAFLAYRIARPCTGNWPALGGAALTIAMASMEFGQPTYSELPATAFLMAAVWALAQPPTTLAPVTLGRAALAGLCLSLAVFCRTNLGVAALAGGLLLLGAALLRSPRVDRLAFLAYGAAGLVPPALMTAIYAMAGQIDTLRLAMIDVPLAYSGQQGLADVLLSHISQFYYTAGSAPLIFLPAVLLIAAGVPVMLTRLVRRGDGQWHALVVLAMTGAVLVSLLAGGAAYPHYWLQVLPLLAVIAAHALALMKPLLLRFAGTAMVLIPCGAALTAEAPQALRVLADPAATDDGFGMEQAARHIARTSPEGHTVWALHKHLVHWYLDAPQLSRAGVHPNNLAPGPIIGTLAKQGYVGADELDRVIRSLPDFIVTDGKGVGVDWVRQSGKPIDSWLAAHYRLDARFGDVIVYRRSGPRG
ncbi:MAG: glycosyltransferase family 39 protein [Novosphingobium sp.]|nr:glycosyltransferase family 39 protein [Novosphingobium sp.]